MQDQDLEDITVYLPWIVSDYLDMHGYKGNIFTGIVDDENKIIVGYDGELTIKEANKLVEIVNKDPSIAAFIMKERINNRTNSEALHRILEIKS